MVAHMPFDALSTQDSALPRSNSLLSRFSPLSKRTRNIFDITVEPDDSFKTYSPGEIIRGHVVLSVLKGFDITHLVVALHGYAKVYKHSADGQIATELLVNGKGTRGLEYLGNGLCSLFHDEQALCGSGFLKKQVYRFGFELQFPAKGLPSAIEFERGRIAYMISATVTRPTTIAPTTTRHRNVSFQDRIDIESMYSPKTRVISLEPVSRRGKVKRVKASPSVMTQDAGSRKALSRHDTQNSNNSRCAASQINPPLSPAPSEDTVATTQTASTGSVQIVDHGSHSRGHSPQISETRSSITSMSAHTITATTELLRHGALPGDVIPIRVLVHHTKRDVRGVVIATLYRQGRIDMLPSIPSISKGKEKRSETENVYPKSRTGLGGLYFANGSPSSVFRKDLSQSSTMMIVDPSSLTSDVRTSVKVPGDSFPTISNVPGAMISFTYHIEVVLDLAGKLGESRLFPSLTSNGPTFTAGSDNGNQLSSDWAHNILDTSSMRRAKNVVTFELPIVVGTKDSRRMHRAMDTVQQQYPIDNEYEGGGNGNWEGDMYDGDNHYYDPYEAGYYYDEYGNPIYQDQDVYQQDQYSQPPPHEVIPPPQHHEEMDEKSRLRRQEELLMPSQPPDAGQSSSSASVLAPSAPAFPDVNDISSAPRPEVLRPTMPISMSRASARSADTIILPNGSSPPSLPENEHQEFTDDKQELERRRLMARASAPPTDESGAGSSRIPSVPIATAPVIDEDEEYISHALHNEHLDHDHLPRYQR